MIQIIWGILNISVFLFFVAYCITLGKSIREKQGFVAALFFVFGLLVLLSFVSKSGAENSKTKIFDLHEAHLEKDKFKGHVYTANLTLEKDLASTISLHIKYGKSELLKKPISAYTVRTGFVSGTNWKIQTIHFDQSSFEDTCTYTVSGILEWQILGITIYSELKDFTGLTDFKD
ncbi:hypothetical protein [Flavobacterium sp.]|uniref:hypothetical protein n=1 Tax=Flavobacterium sp. TaxID=239 RepID=UPI0026064A6E|nr:hypothetical protein [Flavobacterium sp.]